jgi:hydrogenase nickel incorporation protein HypA/HybF
MHEFSLMQGVLSSVDKAAAQARASRVTEVRLTIGEMAEVVPEALRFAFETLIPDTLCAGAVLLIESIEPRSRCQQCGASFAHDRYHRSCPTCGSLATELIAGREMSVSSIEIEEDEKGAEDEESNRSEERAEDEKRVKDERGSEGEESAEDEKSNESKE